MRNETFNLDDMYVLNVGKLLVHLLLIKNKQEQTI